jgi:Fe-S cluster biogenesis protein NfuA
MKRSVPFVKEYIETVLAPRIQGDGGWVEYQSLEGDRLTLVFRGECSKCLILDRCTAWIEQKIKEDKGQTVTVVPVRKKPFFWDRV